jgi:hypothetical protein
MSDHSSPRVQSPAELSAGRSRRGQAKAAQSAVAQPSAAAQPADGHPVLRALALTAVGAGVLVLMAAAFVLSYPGIHAAALEAGVSRSLARLYPVIFDALLAIACAAVLSLRGAGPISRLYAWLSLVVLLAAAAGADALHSTGTKPPHRTAAAVAAVTPWVLLLIGFGLLLVMLRHARLRRAALAARAAALAPAASSPEPGLSRPALPAGTPHSPDPDLARSGLPATAPLPAETPTHGGIAQSASQSSGTSPAAETSQPSGTAGQPDQADHEDTGAPEPVAGHPVLAAPTEPSVPQPRTDEPAAVPEPAHQAQGHQPPPFHRLWSSPTEPDEDDQP